MESGWKVDCFGRSKNRCPELNRLGWGLGLGLQLGRNVDHVNAHIQPFCRQPAVTVDDVGVVLAPHST